MSDLRLIIGYRNYSTWSMRGWLTLRLSGLDFDVELLPAGTTDFQAAIGAYPPAQLVPVLTIGSRVVWESYAIAETIAELAPSAPLWPKDNAARALARSLCAEMHAGFAALRTHMPMNIRASFPGKGRGTGVVGDIERVVALWRLARDTHGAGGPFLFGDYCLADVFYAPIVMRSRTYGVALPRFAADYADAIEAQPHVAEWISMAREETVTLPQYEM